MVISAQQLKITNLIFAEHSELQDELDLVTEQLFNSETIIDNLIAMDSIKSKQLEIYDNLLVDSQTNIVDLKTIIKRQQYVVGGSLLATLILSVLCLIK